MEMSGQAQRPPGRFLRSGKVKDIYDLDPEHLLFHFTDRVSAFDVVLPTTIPHKGEALCKMGLIGSRRSACLTTWSGSRAPT